MKKAADQAAEKNWQNRKQGKLEKSGRPGGKKAAEKKRQKKAAEKKRQKKSGGEKRRKKSGRKIKIGFEEFGIIHLKEN